MGISLFGRDTHNDVKEVLYGGLYGKDPSGNMSDKEWYDSHVEKRVDGVYLSSLDYRNHAVKSIWAKYKMLPSNSGLTYSMNKLMNVVQEVYLPPKDMKGLYEYTHDNLSEFSQSINNKYLNAGKRENVRVDIQTTNSNVVPWRERYGYDIDYTSGDRVKAKSLKKSGQLQDGDYKKYIEKNKEGYVIDGKLYTNISEKKAVRKSLKKQRRESKKEGTWFDYQTVDSTYSSYGKTNRSANWIKTNLSDDEGTIGEFINKKYTSGDTISSTLSSSVDKYDVDSNTYVDNVSYSHNLNKWSVLNRDNGLVDIIGRQRTKNNNTSQRELKRCMFSITNLATRSYVNPVGTVMWFPPYDLNFQENVSVQWDEKNFVGRGEPIYTYVNTVRNGTLSFTLLIDHPSVINDIVRYPKNDDDDILRFFNGGSDDPIKIGKYIGNVEKTPYIQNEYEFFNNLESTDKVAFDKIKDRLKFFHPAYHSMTPEGFNMRLNFLHQCTRQGVSQMFSSYGSTEYIPNTVFGSPPFCELRIGDFINTRICINSMSITYESSGGMTWDLNPEGIGVQPMLAKVSLGIHILGGQSLNGPVLALCNAVSNNFYANSGVYVSNTDHVVTGSNITYEEHADELKKKMKEIENEIEKLKKRNEVLELEKLYIMEYFEIDEFDKEILENIIKDSNVDELDSAKMKETAEHGIKVFNEIESLNKKIQDEETRKKNLEGVIL